MLDAKLTDDSLLKIYKVSCVSPYIALSPSPSIYYSDKSKIFIKIIERFDLSRIRTVLGTVCLESRGLEFNSSGHLHVCVYNKQRFFIESQFGTSSSRAGTTKDKHFDLIVNPPTICIT